MPPKVKKGTKKLTKAGKIQKKVTKNMSAGALYNAKGKQLSDAEVRRYISKMPKLGSLKSGALGGKKAGAAARKVVKSARKKMPSTLNRQSRPRSR